MKICSIKCNYIYHLNAKRSSQILPSSQNGRGWIYNYRILYQDLHIQHPFTIIIFFLDCQLSILKWSTQWCYFSWYLSLPNSILWKIHLSLPNSILWKIHPLMAIEVAHKDQILNLPFLVNLPLNLSSRP